jgi:hypothetical protein
LNLDGRRYAHTLQAFAIDPDIFDCEQQQAASDEECGGGKDRALCPGADELAQNACGQRAFPASTYAANSVALSNLVAARVHSMPASRPGAISHRASAYRAPCDS